MRTLLLALSLLAFYSTSGQEIAPMLVAAERAFQDARYEEALKLYKKAEMGSLNSRDITNQINSLIGQVNSYQELSKFDDVERVIEKIAQLPHDQKTEAEITFLQGRLAALTGKDEIALIKFDKAIALSNEPQDIVRYNTHKGLALVNMHELIDAEKIHKKASLLYDSMKVDDQTLKAKLIGLNARIKWYTGDFAGSLILFKKELEITLKLLIPDHPEIGTLYGSMGIMYKNLLQYDKALEYYGLSLDIRKKYLGENHLEVANSLNNIGYLLYKKKQFEKALEIHRRALKIRSDQLDPLHLKVLQSTEHIGLCYGGLERFDEAEKYFRIILEGRTKKYGHDHHLTGYAFYNLGAVAVEIPDYEKAAAYFQEAAEIGKKVYGPHNYDQADNYNRLANCHLKLNKTLEAISEFHLALQHNLPGYTWNGDADKIPDLQHYLSFREIQRSLLGLAEAHAAQSEDLETSVAYLKATESVIERFKLNFSKDTDLISISGSIKELADYAIPIYFRKYAANKNRADLEEIFRYTELAKSSALLSKLSDEKAKQISGIPEATLIQDKDFRLKQDSLNTLIISTLESKQDASATKANLFKINREYEEFIKSLEKQYPAYTENKFGLIPASIGSIQAFLAERSQSTVLLSFHLTDDKTLFSMLISENDATINSCDAKNLDEVITTFRKALTDQNEKIFVETSEELTRLLLSPVYPAIAGKDLIVIPGGTTGYIPFDLLLDESGRYLIENHIISYDLSATLLETRKHKNAEEIRVLAYAPEFSETSKTNYSMAGWALRSDELVSLPGARKEVEYVGDIFNSLARLGKDASESSFKQEAADFSILHLATHSIVNESDADYSKLVFSEGDDNEDGFLHAFELINLHLNADLVTLSACNTGVGKIEEGEGVMSLARSFRSAGVPSVVMSLWPASDKSTPELMRHFYENLSKGQPKDLALANAKRAYLTTAQGKARNPFFWGGFVLIGDTSPIGKDRNTIIWLIPMIIVVSLTLVVYKRKSGVA
ncbi:MULTISPECIES: CHAT domain-containing tetratricopeptide repeat protein [unclassified Imperialibacter]|uniref:CHAT domain-containing protein n=1 Tax=unclassified Imperialibacter TaxID=2629706 RepID=UPI001256D5FE|nr:MULTISPECIES: CHAT domain-containing tetratricopeptide repeat protein [unclassified Imperialibacter]CAD5253518.1 putative CHAT domain-containing protein [Imperialibacter sp. 89]CAD5284737.1 putative CHAT domain-containing protein [Imperialibacter sp. 75]VVT31657.1 putative CHAT domain-containing protein [Imperialibacter sp. EC-SDR9]